MTKTDVIDYIDSIKPNVYTLEQKSRWIDLLEEKIRAEILSHFEDAEQEKKVEYDFLPDDWYYDYIPDPDEMVLVGPVPVNVSGRVMVSEKIVDIPVVAIQNNAFEGCKYITGIIIPSSIASIDGIPTNSVIFGNIGSAADNYAKVHEIPFYEMDYCYTLIASGPYEDMYYRWVEAQIDYANNETARYNNAMALFNDAFAKFRNYYNRTHKHKTASLSVL